MSLEGEAKRELHLSGGIDDRRTVSTEAGTVGDGAVGILKVGRVENVESFGTELELGRLRPEWQGFVKCQIQLGECGSGETIAARVSEVLTRRRHSYLIPKQCPSERTGSL